MKRSGLIVLLSPAWLFAAARAAYAGVLPKDIGGQSKNSGEFLTLTP